MLAEEHLAQLRREGPLLAAAVSRAGPDARVPSCPEWRVRDLVTHVSGVHRWAAHIVSTAQRDPSDDDGDRFFGAPPDDGLAAWVLAAHAGLVDALAAAPTDLDCFAFLPAPSPLAFWARRQAHETAIHRVDAELAAGGPVTRFAPQFAADGIAELLEGFYGRPGGRLRCDEVVTAAFETVDTGDRWWVRVGPEGREVRRSADAAGCTARGSADAIYRLLWNRGDRSEIQLDGDRAALDVWRDKAHIVWS